MVSLLYGIGVILLKNILLPLLGTDEATWGFCASYLFWTVGIGAVPTVRNAGLAHLIRTEGYSGQASFGIAFGGILNMLLDPVFIFLFKLEIAGAAIATMLSNVAATVFFLLFLFRIRESTTITPSPKCFTVGGGIPLEVLTVGLPSFVMTLMSTVSNLPLNKMISGYSNEAVGGMALMFFGATPITRLFINDAATVEYGRSFLRIVCLACPTTALNFLAITIFQATGRKVQPLILSLLRKGGLDIPLMLLFNGLVGIDGIAWATPRPICWRCSARRS